MKDHYREFLIWLITPQDDSEKELFKDVVDGHCELMNRIDYLSEENLIEEINNQLDYLGLEIR